MTSQASAAIAASLSSGGVESVGFLNDIICQLWDYINVAGAQVTKDVVEPMFEEMLPGPLKSLRFKKIDLGRKPIQFANVDVHKREDTVIKFDIDVNWDGECDIELEADLIGGFGVESVKVNGRISAILTPLADRLPVVMAAQIAFVNPPLLQLDFTGLANVADLSIIDDTIRKIIDNIVASILVLPNRLLIKLDPSNDYFKTYQQHLGFLRLTVVQGLGLKTPKGFFKDTPDCYCKVRLGASDTWKTSTKKNDSTPEWNETHDFLLTDHDQRIYIDLLDDDFNSDDQLGSGSITVGQLLIAGKNTNLALAQKGEETGVTVGIKCEVMQFVPDCSSFESPENDGEGLKAGLITILVAGASNIPGDRKELGPNVQVTYGKKKFKTPVLMDVPGVDTTNPAFDSSFRIPLTTEMAAAPSDVTFTLYSHKNKMGSIQVPFARVFASADHALTEKFALDNGATINASVRISGIQHAQ